MRCPLVERHPQVRHTIYLHRKASKYGEYQATVEGSPFGGTSIQDEYRSSLSASVTQQLLKGHRFAYNMQSIQGAQQSLRQAELNFQQTRQTILSNTAQAYWNWVYQTELVDIRKTAVAVSEMRIVSAKKSFLRKTSQHCR